MTDTRMGEALWDALKRLPRDSGVVFRHYELPDRERRAMLRKVTVAAHRRGLTVLAAGGLVTPQGTHNRKPQRGLYSRSAHSRRDIVAAERAGADFVFVSPVFATRSHPGARGLGMARFGLMIRGARVPVIALGGMNMRRGRTLRQFGIHGWAGIDAWASPFQGGKANPNPAGTPRTRPDRADR
jgi:thiamine-phosphate pyrophosphorylase